MKRIVLLLFCVVFVPGLGDKCSICLPKAHLRVYERRSCKPVMSPECNCPQYYDCPPEVTTPRLRKAQRRKLKKLGENACIFDDKVFAIEEDLQIPCEDCKCVSSGTARNVSGRVIKGSAFGLCPDAECDGEDEDIPAGCHNTYFSENCHNFPTDHICAGHKKADFRCKVEDKTYRYGERIGGMSKDLCKICVCDEKFDENNLERSTCLQERCYPRRYEHQLEYSSYRDRPDQNILMQHCTPTYESRECCYKDFICDENFDPEAGIFKARPTNLTDTCVIRGKSYKIGQNWRFEPSDTENQYYEGKGGECTCRIPPLMTCYYD